MTAAAVTIADIELAIVEDMAGFTHNPEGFADYSYPWGEPGTELADVTGPRTWQRETFQAIGKHLQNPTTRHQPLRIAVASGHGIGKGLVLNAMVDTPTGLVEWQTLNIGDYVFGADGNPTKILATNHYRREHYRVLFDDGSSLVVSGEHEWNVKGRHERRNKLDTWRTLETQEILRLGVLRKNGVAMAKQWEIPIQGAAEFPESEQPIHPYFVGLWLGDGTKGEPVYAKPYPELAERLRMVSGYQVSEYSDGMCKRIIGMAKHFKSGVFLCGSHERFIPDAYKYASVDQRTELFRGLCDSDGEVHKSGSIGYSSTSKKLAEDVIWLARSLGCKAMMHPAIKMPNCHNADGTKTPGRPCWRVTINAPFNPFTIEHRKAAHKISEARYLSRWMESIEPVGIMDGMCITVEADDHLYQANDFIVTHNSACISMIIDWAMSTCEDCKVVVTATTDTQLRTKTWPEVGKWRRMSMTKDWFATTATAVASNDPDHSRDWRANAVPWSEHNTEAFAGLHNKGKRIVLIFDEASGIASKVWEVAEGALTDEGTEIIWIAFGNPTLNTGRFAECFTRFRHRWITKQIDARTVEGTNRQEQEKWAEDWGEDSDFFRVRVRGEFPRASDLQLIPSDWVHTARNRAPFSTMHDGLVMSIDIARGGADNNVIRFRRGMDARSIPKMKIPGSETRDTTKFVTKVCTLIDEHQPDAVMVDSTGVGGPVADNIRRMRPGTLVLDVNFGSASPDPKFVNMRTYIWWQMREALRAGMAVEDCPDLARELCAPEYTTNAKEQVALEKKDDIKKRLGFSPDDADALAISFAMPIMRRPREKGENKSGVVTEWDEYA